MRDPLRLSAALLVPITLSWLGCGAAAATGAGTLEPLCGFSPLGASRRAER